MTRARLLRAILCLLAAYIIWFRAVPMAVQTFASGWPPDNLYQSWTARMDLASEGVMALSAIALWYFAPRLSGASEQTEDRPWQALGTLFLAGWAVIEFFNAILYVFVSDTFKLLAGYYFCLAIVLALGWRTFPEIVTGIRYGF